MNAKARAKINAYSGYHINPINKLTHYIGIPLILFSTIGLFRYLGWHHYNLGTLSILLVTFYYWRTMDLKIATLFFCIAGLFYYTSLFLSWHVILGIFVASWILQFVGHQIYEKKQPAFLENMEHLLIGPAWLIHRLTSGNRLMG